MNISVETLRLTEYLSVNVYTLKSAYLEARIMNYGGIVMELKVPDRNGRLVDVALGFQSPIEYVATHYMNDCPYFGALIGRYANRIKNGRFRIVEKEYQLDTNNGNNHLHGGYQGFDKLIWKDKIVEYYDNQALKLSLTSNDGDQGYPGQVNVEVIYYIENDNSLGIDYKAFADAVTPVNLTWHGYFNLSGEGNGNILDHVLQLNAPQLTEINSDGIPTGNILDVRNTPFDFTTPHAIGSRIHETSAGYDHNYVRFPYGDLPQLCAVVQSPKTGIKMDVWTTQPGVQLYTSNFLDATLIGKSRQRYGQYAGFCLETQHFPDSPNNPHFPNTLLSPGEIFHESTIYRFDAI